jgi:hypothetical protein
MMLRGELMVTREKLQETLKMYYQSEIHPENSCFKATPQYIKLNNLRQEVKKNPLCWQEFKKYLNDMKSDYVVDDLTYLDEASGFYLDLCKIPGLTAENMDEFIDDYISKGKGILRLFKVYVSILGPYYFHHVFEISPDVNPDRIVKL